MTATATETGERHTWRLTRTELDATREKIAKLNARAAKRGFTGHVDLTAERAEVTETLETGFEVTAVYWDTQITGEAPRYAGWTFVASLDWDEKVGLVTRTAPGVEGTIDRTLLREGWCDHCRTERRRNTTYLLRNADQTRQVGSSCIKDFLGQDIKPVFIHTGSVEDDLFGEIAFGGGGGREHEYATESVLAVAWAVIQEFGFVRSDGNYDRDTPTKVRVSTIMAPPGKGEARDRAIELAARLQPHIAKAAGQAKLIRDYILSDAFTGDSEYVVNLRNVAAAGFVWWKHLGLLVSAPQAWARSVEQDLRRQAEQAELTNERFGAVKERVELTVHIKAIRYAYGDWGTTTIYTLVDGDGHLVKWYSSSAALGDDVNDHTYRIKATIKKHEEYQGTNYTVITRATVLEDTHPAAA